MRILIAEDDRISRTFMKEFMKEYGQCDVAVDGMEALDLFMDAVKKEGIKYVFYQDLFRERDEKLCFSGVIEIVCLVNGRLANSDDYDKALAKHFS